MSISFNCKGCGSDSLYVEHYYSIVKQVIDTLDCGCDKEYDFAAQIIREEITTYSDTFEFDEDHIIGYAIESDETDNFEEEVSNEVNCYDCLDEAEEWDWTHGLESSEIDEDSEEYYVRCDGCNREIEFGWSHPDRGGRIWPAECSDFNPWKSWPEPRYRKRWLEKGWIRPDLRLVI